MRNKKENIFIIKGFTLIEVLISFAILLMVVISVISFFPIGLKSAVSTREQTVAIYLAQEKIEEVISTNYADVAVGETIEASLSTIDSDFSGFSRTTNINYLDVNLNDSVIDIGMKKVQVNVSWQDKLEGSQTTTTLVTLIADL